MGNLERRTLTATARPPPPSRSRSRDKRQALPLTATMFALSEETKERIAKIIDISRVAIHYGYLPLVLYLGYTRSNPRPSVASSLPSPRQLDHGRIGIMNCVHYSGLI